jgi:hypothetical protein
MALMVIHITPLPPLSACRLGGVKVGMGQRW